MNRLSAEAVNLVSAIDPEFTDYPISGVEFDLRQGREPLWTLRLNDGGGIGVGENADSIEPEVGDTARFFGRGFGYVVRGIAILGKGFMYYRTEEQQQALFQKRREERDAEAQETLSRERADRDRRWLALPQPFKQRCARFASNNPNWRRDYEPYELFVSEEAFKFWGYFAVGEKGSKELLEWARLPVEEQEKSIKLGEHSGHTFSMAVRLAEMLLDGRPHDAANYHGAMCALVGCVKYGCRPSDG